MNPDLLLQASVIAGAAAATKAGHIAIFLEWFHTSRAAQAAVAGVLGGLVRWITMRDNWKEGLGATVVGAICAIYLGPAGLTLVESWFKIEITDETGGLSAFLMGILGIGISGLIIDMSKLRRKMIQEELNRDQ